ncbi:MAG: RHS repeat-associated core domain-containing protein [Chthoniobacterales bacterium]
MTITGTPIEGYYTVSGPQFDPTIIYINSLGQWGTRFGGPIRVGVASPPPAIFDYRLNKIVWTIDSSIAQGSRDVDVTIEGGGSVPVMDQPYHDGDGNVPHTNEATNYVEPPYSIHFGPPLNPELTECSVKTAGNQTNCSSCNNNSPSKSYAMARYSIHALLVSLNIQDTPLRYSPPYGPAVDFTVTYNQRESQQPETFTYSNLGPKWTFGWLSYVTDDPNHQFSYTALYRSGGGAEIFAYDSSSHSFAVDPRSHAVLVKTAAGYERRLPDGSKEIFGLSDSTSYPRRTFMTQVIDAAGNPVTISYDASFRITCLTDALGKHTTLAYEESDPLKITKVTDPFGRFATFQYDSNGRLQTITDEIGIQSTFGYLDQSDFVNSILTPYGPTTFTKGESGTNRWIQALDPEGGIERVEYRDETPDIPSTEPIIPNIPGLINSGLNMRNTFYWSKKATDMYPAENNVYDYTKARITHWLQNADGTVSGIAASKKEQLENRVWFTYSGQVDTDHVGQHASPSIVARVLTDDNTTQAYQYEYNDLGKTKKEVDPRKRILSYFYDLTNQIDLTEIRQQTGMNDELLRSFTYDTSVAPPHLPVTETDAAGQLTRYSYNAQGQLRTRTNAKSEQTTYTYGGTAPPGYLESIASPVFNGNSAVTIFGYDGLNRVRTVTNVVDNYTTTTDYDNLDRKTKVTYPDATYEEFKYTDNVTGAMTLDLTGSRDRRGLWTYRHYNANQKMDSITDPANQTTQYGWCTCGALTSITDPNLNKTTFNRDIQSRVYEKVYEADGSKVTYLYGGQTAPNTAGATSRLKSSTDAKNQQTNYLYDVDDNLQQISYADALLPTPTVNYVYDPNYNRVTDMTDGLGTTHYTYYSVAVGNLGAGKLHTTSGPLPDSTITRGYDELGRVTSQDINGTPSNVTYDSLGRAGASSTALGSFGRIYDGVTPRLLTLNYPNGQHSTYTYFDNLHDRRLKTIESVVGTPPGLTSTLSRHDYTYDATGRIQTWNKMLGDDVTNLSFGYDDSDQLTSVLQPGLQFDYQYDDAGNRLRVTYTDSSDHQWWDGYTANNLNQLDSVINYRGAYFPPGGAASITYDANGNMTYDGVNRTFEWDAANRIVAINYLDAGRTEFVYDGLSRRVKILEYDGSTSSTIEPGSGRYETFTVGPFVGPAGNYTLLLQGLNVNGGQNAILLDDLTLDGASVTNSSFENPVVTDYQYRPADAAWTYGDSAGIAANGGAFTSGSGDAPDGFQSAFIQGNGSLWQTFALSSGPHSFSFQAAQAVSVNDSSQQVRMTLLGLPTSTKTFIWNGNTIAEERDATGANVTKRFFAEGEQRVGGTDAGNYYYSRDHLGSVREVTDASGVTKVQYDYDAWGNQVVVTGNMSFDFGYTGHYRHAASNLYLAEYRAYDPTMARWINRDPIAESGGINLYRYVNNDPGRKVDPLGLYAELPAGVPVVAAGAAGLYVGGLIYNAAPNFWAQFLWGWLYPDQNPNPGRPKENRSRCAEPENCPLEDQYDLGPLGGYRCEYWCRKSGVKRVIFVPWEEGGCPPYIPHP